MKGDRGNPGNPGAQGVKGDRGNPGNPGAQGVKGDRGYTGNPGAQGAKGDRGYRGYPGAKGAKGDRGNPGTGCGGVTYVRWGKSTCPSGRQALYSGRAAGAFYSDSGGGGNNLCLPDSPQYTLSYSPGSQRFNEIHGAEYEGPVRTSSQNYNIPCALCSVSTRGNVVMIPARTSCPSGWTEEYEGYLMSEATFWAGRGRTSYVCVDEDQATVPGSGTNRDGAVFYHVEANCTHGIPCPPYNNYQELTCVVCTK